MLLPRLDISLAAQEVVQRCRWCPFMALDAEARCTAANCRKVTDLTPITVPEWCPLRSGAIIVRLEEEL